jgi:hypothetical protein
VSQKLRASRPALADAVTNPYARPDFDITKG